ncbi:Predicted membrane protein involved in D-alanine export [Salinibacter ruber M8]|uniref:Predicted membrane protein involved in D-alanine export n=1 Tax=Salinibacter ruber (strain M8) TaxID=761659 RepID=D5H6H0_SALRM|nr:Predicted membrane protein involved in D-alanine export [Salinibacter ruber M8]
MATYFFAFQIYCDFSGYSDIAIGAAQIMEYDLMENFRRPYHAKSINEFWHRWHISLSTWFRDYLYIPAWWKQSPGGTLVL